MRWQRYYAEPKAQGNDMQKIATFLKGFDHIIWDWNGTLVNDLDYAVSAINRVLSDYRLATISRDHYRNIFRFPVRDYYESLGFDFNRVSFEEVGTRFIENYNAGTKKLYSF